MASHNNPVHTSPRLGSFNQNPEKLVHSGTSEQDPFLTEHYDRLHDSPTQRFYRSLAPIPVGVVFIQYPEMSENDVRGHFRTMKEMGFTCLKDIVPSPPTTTAQLRRWALEEGLNPWWYDDAGWETITEELLDRLGIPSESPISEIRSHDAMLQYQRDAAFERVKHMGGKNLRSAVGGFLKKKDPRWRVPTGLPEELRPAFVEWLKSVYKTIDNLKDAWNFGRAVNTRDAESWDDVAGDFDRLLQSRDLRRIRDLIRFKSDLRIEHIQKSVLQSRGNAPGVPYRAGGEIGLFLPHASFLADMEGIADLMTDAGSFYPSIHLSWHFEETEFSHVPEVYLQASLAQDLFKGGWAASWESSGGPQQISGGPGLHPGAEQDIPGFTVDAGVITQLMLSYLGAGFKGFGIWCWNARPAGNEAGEYALLDRTGRPCERTVRAGLIGRTAQRYRDELWAAHKEPVVGVFYDYENEMMWTALAARGRDRLKRMGVEGRVGAGRALTECNVPWEHVTATDIRNGLAPRYAVMYLPCIISLSSDMFEHLVKYVEQGGRLVVDCPSLWFDEYGRTLDTGEGSLFERLFGCIIRDFQYSSNVVRRLEGLELRGCVADIDCGAARVLHHYDNGIPAITENRIGRGTAVFLGYEASRDSFSKRHETAEKQLVDHVLGSITVPFTCTGSYVFRLSAPVADHYFLVNKGEATRAVLDFGDYRYDRIVDALTEEQLGDLTGFGIDAHSGRWLRCEKRRGTT